MSVLTVTPAADGRTVSMVKGPWSQTIPTAALPDWIALYRRLRDRDNGRHRRFYESDTDALETAQREISRQETPTCN